MAITVCPPGVWTTVDAPGIIEARGRGFYVDTSGTEPANPAEAYALASNSAMVVESGTVAIQPAQPVMSVICVTTEA